MSGDRRAKVGSDSTFQGRCQSIALSFIVNRPQDEPGFALERQEVGGRSVRYTTRAYSADRPAGERYKA